MERRRRGRRQHSCCCCCGGRIAGARVARPAPGAAAQRRGGPRRAFVVPTSREEVEVVRTRRPAGKLGGVWPVVPSIAALCPRGT
eukprot:scaffold4525_cov403-Prasinococcus_capsulatus_cf.AAC.1